MGVMKKIVKIFLVFYSVLVVNSLLIAAGTAGTSGADFLELGVGSRPISMGEAFVAEINDVNSIYYNPAGIATIRYPILSIHHQELIEDSRLENVSLVYPVYGGYLGVSNSLFWVPPFEKIDIDGNNNGSVQFYNGVFTTAYGYDLGYLNIGGSVKYIYQRIDTEYVNSFAMDIGLLKGFYMYSPLDTYSRNFYVGVSINNIGTKAKDDPLPRIFRLGFSYKLAKWVGFNVDFVETFIAPSDLYDFTYGFDESFTINTGVEFNYLEILSFRTGYQFDNIGSLSLGIGFNYVINGVSFLIDTSYVDSGIFGPTYSLNVSFKLIPKVVTIRAKKRSNKYYKEGIKSFVVDDVDDAIRNFEESEDLNPYRKNLDKKIESLNF